MKSEPKVVIFDAKDEVKYLGILNEETVEDIDSYLPGEGESLSVEIGDGLFLTVQMIGSVLLQIHDGASAYGLLRQDNQRLGERLRATSDNAGSTISKVHTL